MAARAAVATAATNLHATSVQGHHPQPASAATTTPPTLTRQTTAESADGVWGAADDGAASSEQLDMSHLLPALPFRGEGEGEPCPLGRSVDETCRRALDHFPCPNVAFPTPTLEFDFRVAVALKNEPSQVQGRAHKEITAVSSGSWSGSFGHGKVMAGGYDLGQARGFRPIRIVEGAFIMQTTDEPPATLEMRTRGSLSGPCDILDALLSTRSANTIDPRKYGFRMFLTIKTADKRYAEIVNCGLWVASGVWKAEELIIDAYRVA